MYHRLCQRYWHNDYETKQLTRSQLEAGLAAHVGQASLASVATLRMSRITQSLCGCIRLRSHWHE